MNEDADKMTDHNPTERTAELSPVKQALVELREMRARLQAAEQARQEPVAVIGMGCRFPGGANDPESFWELLVNGVDAIREVPPERWDADEFYDPDPDAPGKIVTRWGGFLDQIDEFDPEFFGISPREAAAMDPQQRMILEVSWEALERAGQAPDRLSGSQTGVFIGISTNDYYQLLSTVPREEIDVYLATGTTLSIASGRLAYLLGLQGPALSIDTACSSSLVAVHEAVQSLRNGECNLALAGGVNLVLRPEILINFSRARMISADGRCKTFDARADGFVRSEGCGMVVLKRLSDAIKDRDHILAVIRGSAVNQDGRSTGLTAPNGLAQEAVIRTALANGNVSGAQVSYVEAHGTGTSLGDPIEVQALAAVLGQGRSPERPLKVGSVKTNLGHLEAAAGVAGLMKAILILQHKEIPPHLHLQEPNPYIPWERIPVDVPVQREPLQPVDGRYLVGTSSFGFSGTNAHIVLEAAPEPPPVATGPVEASTERPVHLLTLSAKSPASLRELAHRYQAALSTASDRFPDLCYTANTGRAHLPHRLALVARSAEEANDRLRLYLDGEEVDGLVNGQVFESVQPEVVFLFTGHGAHYLQMGRLLYDTQPTFRQALDRCAELMRPLLERPLLEVLYTPGDPELLNQMTYAQPALFAVEYALAQLWLSWGVKPSAVLGHSVGEYAAACIAGLFNLEDGLKLVAARGRLMDSLPQQGEMAAVFADEETVAQALAPYTSRVSIAVINGPQNIVISGEKEALHQVIADLKGRRIKSKVLAVAQAAHSPMLDPILDEFEAVAREIAYHEPQVAHISAVTGRFATFDEIGNAAYWRRHLRQPVRFAPAMQTAAAEGRPVFVEIGPNPVLLAMGRRCIEEDLGDDAWLPSLREGWDEWEQMLESLARLYVQGVPIDWAGVERDYPRRKIPLPTYPWNRQRYWPDRLSAPQATASQATASPEAIWQAVEAAGRLQENVGPLDLNLHTYPDKWAYLDRLTSAYIVRVLQELGVFARPGEAHTAAGLVTQCNLQPGYRVLIQRWLDRLEKEGYLERGQAEQYVLRRPFGPEATEIIESPVPPVVADISPLVEYVQRSGESLAALLKGEESPLEVLFPGGSFHTAEYIYQKWPLVGYFNSVLRGLLLPLVHAMHPDRKVRILEVGAGSGGTTSALISGLPAERVEYTFTDISDLFLARAQENFQSYPFLRFMRLDLEQDPEAQGFVPHSFDIIIAANVLHATRDLSRSLERVRSLLGPGGVLLAFEVTEPLSWFDVTTALIEGWGHFEDPLRKDSPLVSAGQWLEVLEAVGFVRAAAFPQAGTQPAILGSSILMAQAPTAGVEAQQCQSSTETVDTPAVPASAQPEVAAGAGEKQDEFLSRLQAALPGERKDLLIQYVRQHLGRILRRADAGQLDRRQRLMDLGVDSLMAVELKNRLQTGLQLTARLPSTLIYDYPTIEAVAGYLEQLIFTADSEAGAGQIRQSPESENLHAVPDPGSEGSAADIEDLSEAEIEAMLLNKLKNL